MMFLVYPWVTLGRQGYRLEMTEDWESKQENQAVGQCLGPEGWLGLYACLYYLLNN